MIQKHECIQKFETQKIDNCKGEGFNRCYGEGPITLEAWFEDQDGTECYMDNWMEFDVNFCPYCGLKSLHEPVAFEKREEWGEVK